jgi:hypothetical protein
MCCCCGEPLGDCHLVRLEYGATWAVPTWVEQGVFGAIAVVCDTCWHTRQMGEIRWAIERRNGDVYHDVKELLPAARPTRDN